MGERIGVGIVGSGVHGSRYARHILADMPGLRLAAVSRRSAVGLRQAREWGCVYHADWQDLVADRAVQAVVASTTPDLNPAIVTACAAAGKPLLVEKPLAIGVEEGEIMVAEMAAAGLPFTVAQTLRYNPVILGLQYEIARAGRLHSFAANQRLEPSVHDWLERPEVAGGGVILHTAVHLFDALRFITGRDVLRVRAETRRRYNPALEDLFLGIIEMEDGLTGTVDASKVGPSRMGRYEFVGDAGQLQGDQIHGSLEFLRGTKIESLPVAPQTPTLPLLLADWEAHLRREGPNPIPAEEGLAALRICAACTLAATTGNEVEL